MSVLILLYHDLSDEASLVSTRIDLFGWQMQWLDEQRIPVIPLSRVVDGLRGGEPLPLHAVVITFDDGFASVHSQALPILARYRFPATVFLVSGYCGGSQYNQLGQGSRLCQNNWPSQPPDVPTRPLLTWPQIREMEGQGIEFGAHGFSHARLDRLPAQELAVELLHSKVCLEHELGRRVDLLAYPYGRYNASVQAVVQGAYRGACAAWPGVVTPHSEPLALPRIEAHYLAKPLIFRQLAHPLFPGYLLLRRTLRASASVILRRAWQ